MKPKVSIMMRLKCIVLSMYQKQRHSDQLRLLVSHNAKSRFSHDAVHIRKLVFLISAPEHSLSKVVLKCTHSIINLCFDQKFWFGFFV